MIHCQCGNDSTLVSTGIYTLKFTFSYLNLCHCIPYSLLDFAQTGWLVF